MKIILLVGLRMVFDNSMKLVERVNLKVLN